MRKIAAVVVLILTAAVAFAETKSGEGVGGWSWEETIDPMTDAHSLVFIQMPDPNTLIAPHLEMTYVQGSGWYWALYSGWGWSGDYHVTYRFGKSAPVTETFKMRGSDGKLLSCPSKAVLPNDRLVIRIEREGGGEGLGPAGKIFSFDLSGLLPTVEKWNKSQKK